VYLRSPVGQLITPTVSRNDPAECVLYARFRNQFTITTVRNEYRLRRRVNGFKGRADMLCPGRRAASPSARPERRRRANRRPGPPSPGRRAAKKTMAKKKTAAKKRTTSRRK
jgi:hypothetical protein